MTKFIPEQSQNAASVYVDGAWDPATDTISGGFWTVPAHGGLCRNPHPKHAVNGPHLHWNGAYDMYCPREQHCPTPSCRAATEEDRAHTVERERRETAPETITLRLREFGVRLDCVICGAELDKFEVHAESGAALVVCATCCAKGEEAIRATLALEADRHAVVAAALRADPRFADEADKDDAHERWHRTLAASRWVIPSTEDFEAFRRNRYASYWGLCPVGREQPDNFIHVKKAHFATCSRHKTAWHVGDNLMSTYWRMDDDTLRSLYGHTDVERIARESLAELEAEYRRVDPIYDMASAELPS